MLFSFEEARLNLGKTDSVSKAVMTSGYGGCHIQNLLTFDGQGTSAGETTHGKVTQVVFEF